MSKEEISAIVIIVILSLLLAAVPASSISDVTQRSWITVIQAGNTALQDQKPAYLAQGTPDKEETVSAEELIKIYAPEKLKIKTRGIGGVTTGHTEARKGFQNILFDVNSYNIKGISYRQLDEIGKALRSVMSQYPRSSFSIEGHTDNIGSKSYNRLLSLQRADAVKNYLVSRFDLESTRIMAIGLGEDKPAASNDTQLGRSQNRRVEIVRR